MRDVIVLGYGRRVVARRRVDGGDDVLTLGGLHRALRDRLGDDGDVSVRINFEQRSAMSPAIDAAGVEPDLFMVRRFEARLAFRRGDIEDAELIASGMSGRPHSRLRVLQRDGQYLYSTEGLRYGVLQNRPDLFDLPRFEKRLDTVAVNDATIEQAQSGAERVIVLDADVDVEQFRTLIALFAADADPARDELDLRSYSVALTAAGDVALDYWWSLVGNEAPEYGDAYRHTVACHVHVSVAELQGRAQDLIADGESKDSLDVSLPQLRHIDDVWRFARAGVEAERLEAEAG